MKLLRLIPILLLFTTLPFLAFGQSEVSEPEPTSTNSSPKKTPFSDRIFVGGGFGLSFGTVTYINVAPLIGYRVTDNFSAGIGSQYTFYKVNYDSPFDDFKTHIYGGSVFARHIVLQNFFVQTELELLNMDNLNNYGGSDYSPGRINVPAWLVGGGINQISSGGSGFFIGIFYDVIQDPNSPYNGPIFRAGGFLGL